MAWQLVENRKEAYIIWRKEKQGLEMLKGRKENMNQLFHSPSHLRDHIMDTQYGTGKGTGFNNYKHKHSGGKGGDVRGGATKGKGGSKKTNP